MNTEYWSDIPGYEGLYQVSDHGRVKSLSRFVGHNYGGKKLIPEKVMALSTLPGGYKIVSLYSDNARTKWRVNRLVLIAFVGVPAKGMAACHRDNDPSNNALGNLRWDTYSGNEADKIANGTTRRGERNHFAKLTATQAAEIKRRISEGVHQKSLAEWFNVSPSTITAIKKGRAWAHL